MIVAVKVINRGLNLCFRPVSVTTIVISRLHHEHVFRSFSDVTNSWEAIIPGYFRTRWKFDNVSRIRISKQIELTLLFSPRFIGGALLPL